MGPLNPSKAELIVALFCFLTTFGVLGRVLLPRARRVIDERADAIGGGLARAEATRQEAADALAEYRLQISEARHQAARILQEAHETGALLIADARLEAQHQRDQMIAAADAELDADRVLVEAALRVAITDLSTELASRVVGEPLAEFAAGSPSVQGYLDNFATPAE